MTDKPNLAAALAQVQAKLPTVAKGETATVQKKAGGTYSYNYADLADVSQVILPMLGAVGLAWITKPTFNDGGKFVLVYKLRHTCGEEEVGEYPLPPSGTPQEIGSAITYARRYALCAVTGVAPAADDDDGAAATRQAQRSDWDDARPRTTPDARLKILANAEAAIDAAPVGGLAAIEERVAQYVNRGTLTPGDGVALDRRIKARMELLAANRAASLPAEDRTAEPGQSDLGGDWPEPRKPGSGDPA